MNNIVLPFEEHLEKYKLGKEYEYTTRGDVHINDIVGSCHYDYIGKTFNQCLHIAKRIDIAKELYYKNPDYYLSDLPKDMNFYVFDFGNRKEAFVQEGNHRVFIGKMLQDINEDFTGFKNVLLTVIKIDETLLNINHSLLNKFNNSTFELNIKTFDKKTDVNGNKGYKTFYEYYLYCNKTRNSPYIGTFLPENVKKGKVEELIEKRLGFTYKIKKALGFV